MTNVKNKIIAIVVAIPLFVFGYVKKAEEVDKMFPDSGILSACNFFLVISALILGITIIISVFQIMTRLIEKKRLASLTPEQRKEEVEEAKRSKAERAATYQRLKDNGYSIQAESKRIAQESKKSGLLHNFGYCPSCTKKISMLANKCPHCTADL